MNEAEEKRLLAHLMRMFAKVARFAALSKNVTCLEKLLLGIEG